ncbi:50S ribosomal protein L3 [Desulfobotulus mexicanus]|uniref:Large ribosomal subunit protein uL3 n=1 Tax=Desulfobotulus mexicanus TaxID=2586642 RepID=A0A5Q4VFG5_9BACT|nr:50S ribosomal protein L3 [Desulfobotulus mexicanus]TYT74771.1 50S ribosomal protein L3 [Desulfobotulus mexicanus]
MCKGLIAKKLGMTRIFNQDGNSIPVTVVQAGPCVVTQIKTVETDGYNALQVAFGPKKEQRVNKPMKGHFAKAGVQCFSVVKEFAVEDPSLFTLGQEVTVDLFKVGDLVDVVGTTQGKGFAGTVKRHGFHRGPVTHGSHNVRAPGSVGCSAWPSRVVKGKKMPGHMGVDRKTARNLQIVDIRPEENLLLIKGAVPGHKTGILEIKKRKYQK